MQTTLYIFMKDTSNQSLVRNALGKGFFLQPSKISGRKADIDPGIFLEHGLCVFLMPLLRLICVFCTFYLTRFKRLKNFSFFLV